MTDWRGAVVAGVDAHTDEHHVAALDRQGRLLGAAAFPTTGTGYGRLIGWLRGYGEVERVGVESTGAYAAGLVRALQSEGIMVVEVNQPHPHARQRLGKSDPIDAELAARAALSGTARAPPERTGGIVEAIRQLSVTRAGALKARTAALQQLDDLIITAPEQLRGQLRRGRTLKARAALCRQLRPDSDRLHEPTQAAKLALRTLAGRVSALEREIHELDQQLERLVSLAAPHNRRALRSRHPRRKPAAQHRRPKHRAAARRGRLRQDLRRRSDPKKLRTQQPAPPRLRRRPPGQPGTAHDRRLPAPLLRADPHPRTQTQRPGVNRREILPRLNRYIARQTHHTLRADLEALNGT
jgi:transposase